MLEEAAGQELSLNDEWKEKREKRVVGARHRVFVFAYQLEITNNAADHHPTRKVCVWECINSMSVTDICFSIVD